MNNYQFLVDNLVEKHMNEFWNLSKFIHSNPEIAFNEFKACEAQINLLRSYGFEVEENVGTLETAYKATYFKKNPEVVNIGIVSEYDALPIGHACGHNLIAASSVGSAIVTKLLMDEYNIEGTLTVIGTPAEENGGGKIILLENKVFDGIEAIFMMHPTSYHTRLAGECLSSKKYKIKFYGKPSHSGSHPEDGINALSCANLYLVANSFKRQHLKSDMRIAEIITNGGSITGQIPEYSEIKGSISCFKLNDLNLLENSIRSSAIGCSQAMNCKYEIEMIEGYQGRIPNETLSNLCRSELLDLGEELMDGMPIDFGGEDLGNVSRKIPICNPYVTIFKDYKISGHTEKFKQLAISEEGYRCVEVTSKSIARTIIKLFMSPNFITLATKELEERLIKE
jgi:amidohydrolase